MDWRVEMKRNTSNTSLLNAGQNADISHIETLKKRVDFKALADFFDSGVKYSPPKVSLG
jgi:hypothetical protein